MPSLRDFYQVSLKLLLKNSKGEILALKALDYGSFAGFYDLPGGRIGVDEFETDFKDILTREVREEIGNIRFRFNPKPVAVGRHLIQAVLTSEGKDIHVLYIFFEAEYQEGAVKVSREHQGHQWLNLEQIKLSQYFTSGILEGIQMYLGKITRSSLVQL